MSAQLALELGHALAEQAADHAGPEWKDAAYQAFCDYAGGNALFTAEEVRQWARDLPEAPEPRAWGHVVLRAKREGVIDFHGYAPASSLSVHGMIVKVWRSRINRREP